MKGRTGATYLRRKLTLTFVPCCCFFPLTLPLWVVHQHFLSTLITTSCFLHLGLNGEHQATQPGCWLRCVKQAQRSFGQNSSGHSWRAGDSGSLYHNSLCLYSLTLFITSFLAVLQLTRCLVFSGLCQCLLSGAVVQWKSQCWDTAAGLFTLTICCCSTWNSGEMITEKKNKTERHMQIENRANVADIYCSTQLQWFIWL